MLCTANFLLPDARFETCLVCHGDAGWRLQILSEIASGPAWMRRGTAELEGVQIMVNWTGQPLSRISYELPIFSRKNLRATYSPTRNRCSLAKFAFKPHALHDPEACDDTPLDLLAGLRGLAPSTIPQYLAVFRGRNMARQTIRVDLPQLCGRTRLSLIPPFVYSVRLKARHALADCMAMVHSLQRLQHLFASEP